MTPSSCVLGRSPPIGIANRPDPVRSRFVRYWYDRGLQSLRGYDTPRSLTHATPPGRRRAGHAGAPGAALDKRRELRVRAPGKLGHGRGCGSGRPRAAVGSEGEVVGGLPGSVASPHRQERSVGRSQIAPPCGPGWRSCESAIGSDGRLLDSCTRLLVNKSAGPINSLRLPAYHRMDLRVTRTFQVGRGTLSAFLDIFNFYNRENLRSYAYGIDLASGRPIQFAGETLLPILPSFGLTWEF